MNILTIPVGELSTNCYLVSDANGTAVAIDPGADAAAIRRALEEHSLQLRGILLTHAHFDHIGAVAALANTIPVFCHTLDAPALRDGRLNLSAFFGCPVAAVADAVCIEDGDELSFGEMTFTVLHTPGHTVGSVCFQSGDVLFAGDTLFCESIGRTDFPGGDLQAMRASLRRLASLDSHTRVYPGHGEPTTVSHECRCNPYMPTP
ncbi:MAG: MBL fold metallo-hydrolase [Ruminococcaceae bacterium]|nr:MBL fold metallo-hydrolase [Oscillospiraceae bacterium]